MGTVNSVLDGKTTLTNEQLGAWTRRTNEIIKRINEGSLDFEESMDLLQGVVIENKHPFRGVLRGTHEIKAIEHAVDCSLEPSKPGSNFTIELNKKGGVVRLERRGDDLYVDGKKIVFSLSKKQINGKVITGHDLREELSGKKVLSAIILDYLLAHPELIPESWKKDEKGNTWFISFWGTIFRGSDGNLYVRYLYWSDGGWQTYYSWLDGNFFADGPAAVSAS